MSGVLFRIPGSGQRIVSKAEFVKSLLSVRILQTDFPAVSIRMVSYSHNRTVAKIDESILYISPQEDFLNLF
jgi:hypothetical protein